MSKVHASGPREVPLESRSRVCLTSASGRVLLTRAGAHIVNYRQEVVARIDGGLLHIGRRVLDAPARAPAPYVLDGHVLRVGSHVVARLHGGERADHLLLATVWAAVMA